MGKKYITNIARTITTYIIWIITLPPLFLLCVLLSLLPESTRYDNRIYFLVTTLLCKAVIKATFLDIKVIGRNNIPLYPNNPSIFICNHSSALDIPLVDALIGSYPHIWMSKVEYGKIPLAGLILKRMHILVKRNTKDALNALFSMISLVKEKNRHAVLFPEGTRYPDGKVHLFLPGFALLAIKLKRPVIPIFISGIHNVFPKNSLLIDSYNKHITINIGEPVYCPEGMQADEFVQHVHKLFVHELNNTGT